VRSFASAPLSLEELAQILWAAQGITEPAEDAPPGFSWPWMGGLRTAPSAGALYPLELYAVVGLVEGLDPGLYRYVPTAHALERVMQRDLRDVLAGGALRQATISEAPASLVFGAVVGSTEAKYGDRAVRYVQMEVGAAAQNVYLQCQSLELGTVFIGAFQDEEVKEALALPDDQRVFAILPVGRPAERSPR
jgi:SagB-type dehydrogenase family enzyme